MELSQIIDNIYHLPVQAKNKLMKSISYVEYPSGYRLYRENAKETRAYFMKKGLARAYSIANGHETTFWFGRERDFITPIAAMASNGMEYGFVELLEDCELYVLDLAILNELYASDIHIANWGIRHLQKEVIRAEKRYITRQFKTSLERYQEFISRYPDIIQSVKLSMVASYLGISVANLSRIRGQVR